MITKSKSRLIVATTARSFSITTSMLVKSKDTDPHPA